MKVIIRAALVAAVVATFVASGGATAASNLITGKQIKDSSITGRDVKNRSLTPSDFRGSVKGDRGPQGLTGPAGAPGPAGIASVTDVVGPDVSVAPGTVGGANAACPPGSVVVGTGFFAGIGNPGFAERFGNEVGIGVVNDSSITIAIHAQAICAAGAGVVGARSVTRADHSAFDAALAALRTAH